jgi:hypothetical protein
LIALVAHELLTILADENERGEKNRFQGDDKGEKGTGPRFSFVSFLLPFIFNSVPE